MLLGLTVANDEIVKCCPARLFASSALPKGSSISDSLTRAEILLAEIESPAAPARYKTFTAKRRIVSFGAGYDFDANRPTPAPELHSFLEALRQRASAWAGIAVSEFSQCTVAEYAPGTQLGWHRDVPTFGVVIGVSLTSPCRMRLRPYPHMKHGRAPCQAIQLEPRSIYVLRDDARWRWQHAISPTKALRYSITFRTMAAVTPAARPI